MDSTDRHTSDVLLTPRQVCEVLNISRSTLAAWARNGTVHAVTLPSGHRRFSRTEVEAIARGEVSA